MKFLIHLLVYALAIFATAYIMPGVAVRSFWTAIVVAIVLGFINTVIKPILIILTLPITIFTLGLFTLVLNALLILLASAIVPGFIVVNFWWALLYSLVLSVVNWFLNHRSRQF